MQKVNRKTVIMKIVSAAKKAIIIGVIAMRILIIVAGLCVLTYTALTGTKIGSLISNPEWWLFFFIFDMWTHNFATTKTPKA